MRVIIQMIHAVLFVAVALRAIAELHLRRIFFRASADHTAMERHVRNDFAVLTGLSVQSGPSARARLIDEAFPPDPAADPRDQIRREEEDVIEQSGENHQPCTPSAAEELQ